MAYIHNTGRVVFAKSAVPAQEVDDDHYEEMPEPVVRTLKDMSAEEIAEIERKTGRKVKKARKT